VKANSAALRGLRAPGSDSGAGTRGSGQAVGGTGGAPAGRASSATGARPPSWADGGAVGGAEPKAGVDGAPNGAGRAVVGAGRDEGPAPGLRGAQGSNTEDVGCGG